MNHIDAMKLVLENSQPSLMSPGWTFVRNEAITALREALAEQPAQTDWEAVAADQALTIALLRAEQPAQQEPVYFCDYGYEGWGKVDAAMAAENRACGMTVEAYYTSPHPAQRKPLTDEEIDAIGAKIFSADFLDVEEIHANRDIARAIEAAHGIKE
ncbi:MAG: hypothetical protein RL758_129 [Pseudomonadota bacterium]|jgi:hypothetical protein